MSAVEKKSVPEDAVQPVEDIQEKPGIITG
jgi:hypothetical protein